MKKMIVCLTVIVLICTMMMIADAGDSNKAAFDASIFEVPDDLETYPCFDCMCSDYQSVYHYVNLKEGITFYQWVGGDGKMAPLSGGCFGRVPDDSQAFEYATVVFWNGVPNLVKDLFKKWESCTHDVYIPDSVKQIAEDCFVDGSTITLHFTKNNQTALAYAQIRGMAFEVMDGERALGDVNFDKSVDMKDTLSLRKSIANLPAAVEICSTDLNADGSVDMKDVLTLRKQIANAAA